MPRPQKYPKKPKPGLDSTGTSTPTKTEPTKLGKPKGSRGRNSFVLKAALDKMEFNLLEEYLTTVSMINDPDARATHLQSLFKYIYPKIKETDQESAVLNSLDAQAEATDKEKTTADLLAALAEMKR